jgi:type IV pilus assembly protein PilE
MKFTKGFTLIEVMVVVALIAILASLALPAYSDYVTRGKIPDATSNLASKRVLMEQFFQDNHTYVGAPACNNDATTSKNFTFACSVAPTTSTFTLQATGIGSMAGFSYTVDESNTKASAIVAPAKSKWIASSASCWITNTGGQC